MNLMCAWQTSEMPTFSHQHSKSITSSVDQSLEWKMLARWLSCTGQSMVEKQAEEISETTLDHACISSILLHIQLILHYLGGKVSKVQLENGVNAWAFSSSQYVQTAVKNVEEDLMSEDWKCWKMSNKADTSLTTTYRPELDISRELNVADAAYYQSLIGILRWIVELGQVDMCLKVSMMSSHLALPREGHLEQVLHIFAYLG